MAVDTPNKRKSVINFSLPGLFLLPIPDGTIDSVNRRQMTDSYALTPNMRSRSFWVQDRDSSQSWTSNRNPSTSWVKNQNPAQTWIQDKDIE